MAGNGKLLADLAAGDTVLLGEHFRLRLVKKTGAKARLLIEAPSMVAVKIDRGPHDQGEQPAAPLVPPAPTRKPGA